MIRPASFLCFCAFAAAGAWLYNVKHQVASYDKELRDIRRQIEQTRDRTMILRAEWALLNEPDRLRQVAMRHLPLEPMQPQQFARLPEMDRRLPQVVAFAGAPNLFAPLVPSPQVPGRGAAPTMLAAVVPVTAATVPVAAAAPGARPAAAPALAPAANAPRTPAADPRAPEAPALQALAATVAAQRASQQARVTPPVPPRPAPMRDVAPRAPSPTLAQSGPSPGSTPQFAPSPRIMPASVTAAQAETPMRATRPAPAPVVAAQAPAPSFVSALGGSSLSRPMLAPPVPVSASASR